MLLILEALISGSNNIPDLEKQIQYIHQLITPLTTFLDTPDLVNRCSQFSSFLQLLEVSVCFLCSFVEHIYISQLVSILIEI